MTQRGRTDLEKVELAIRRVYDHLRIQPHETGIEATLKMIADEIASARIDGEKLNLGPDK